MASVLDSVVDCMVAPVDGRLAPVDSMLAPVHSSLAPVDANRTGEPDRKRSKKIKVEESPWILVDIDGVSHLRNTVDDRLLSPGCTIRVPDLNINSKPCGTFSYYKVVELDLSFSGSLGGRVTHGQPVIVFECLCREKDGSFTRVEPPLKRRKDSEEALCLVKDTYGTKFISGFEIL
jgi:hypothetical protein